MAGKVSRTLQMLLELRKEMRESVAELREQQQETNQRLDRLEGTVHRDLVDVANVLVQVRDILRAGLDERHRVDDHERRIGALEQRLVGT